MEKEVTLKLESREAFMLACFLYGQMMGIEPEERTLSFLNNLSELEKLMDYEDLQEYIETVKQLQVIGREQLERVATDMIKVPKEMFKHVKPGTKTN